MAGSRTRQNLNLIGGVLAAAIGGYCAFRVWVYVNRLRPDPQAIVIAMYPPPKDGRYYDDEEIFRAIREFGDVNGSAETSQPGNRITFLEMAIRLERRRQVKLLLDHGADPDREDESGGTPLFHAIKWGEEREARAWLHAGAKWSGPSGTPGKSVEDWATEHRPEMLGRLRWVRAVPR